jgi:hypothetical protein
MRRTIIRKSPEYDRASSAATTTHPALEDPRHSPSGLRDLTAAKASHVHPFRIHHALEVKGRCDFSLAVHHTDGHGNLALGALQRSSDLAVFTEGSKVTDIALEVRCAFSLQVHQDVKLRTSLEHL